MPMYQSNFSDRSLKRFKNVSERLNLLLHFQLALLNILITEKVNDNTNDLQAGLSKRIVPEPSTANPMTTE